MPTRDPEKLRAKWKRNKRTQRARHGPDRQPEDEDRKQFNPRDLI